MLKQMKLKMKYLVLLTQLKTKTALNSVENKTPSVSNLVKKKQKKTDSSTKVNEIEKGITDHNLIITIYKYIYIYDIYNIYI